MVYMNILVYPKSMEIKRGEKFRSDALSFLICVLYNWVNFTTISNFLISLTVGPSGLLPCVALLHLV
jgi:hypothetical protein